VPVDLMEQRPDHKHAFQRGRTLRLFVTWMCLVPNICARAARQIRVQRIGAFAPLLFNAREEFLSSLLKIAEAPQALTLYTFCK
jgi:hypothetical protein